jgi:hypothetical protein
MRTRTLRLIAILGVSLTAAAAIGVTSYGSRPPSVIAAPNGQDTAQPLPRPDLALALRDLPPGYEEVPGLDLVLGDTPLEDRVLRRAERGPGPGWIWTMTYQTAAPVTQERVQSLGLDLAVTLSRVVGTVVELTDWTVEDPAGLGPFAVLYGFQYHALGSDTGGDGALAVFGPGPYLSYLAVLNADGESLGDAARLAALVNARVAQRADTAPAAR